MEAERGRCLKCGRQIAAQQTLCGACNRAEMATPSATQYHGTVAAAIVVGVLGLAIAAGLAVRGVGPYDASAVSVSEPNPGGLDVRLAVSNRGSRAGRAKCQIIALDAAGRRMAAVTTLTPAVEGGGSVVVAARLPGVTRQPARITASCA